MDQNVPAGLVSMTVQLEMTSQISHFQISKWARILKETRGEDDKKIVINTLDVFQ